MRLALNVTQSHVGYLDTGNVAKKDNLITLTNPCNSLLHVAKEHMLYRQYKFAVNKNIFKYIEDSIILYGIHYCN